MSDFFKHAAPISSHIPQKQDLHQDYLNVFVKEHTVVTAAVYDSITLVRCKHETTWSLYKIDGFRKLFIAFKPCNGGFYGYYICISNLLCIELYVMF